MDSVSTSSSVFDSEWLLPLITGTVSGIVASVIFLFILMRLRPRFVISQQIAVNFDHKSQQIFEVKVFNKRARNIVNVKARFYAKAPLARPGGKVYYWDDIKLERDELLVLPAYKQIGGPDSFRFRTKEDLYKICATQGIDRLVFLVYGADPISGIGSVSRMTYLTDRDIFVEGQFRADQSLAIEPVELDSSDAPNPGD